MKSSVLRKMFHRWGRTLTLAWLGLALMAQGALGLSDDVESAVPLEQQVQAELTSLPPNPTTDIEWGRVWTSQVSDIQAAFNYARLNENEQLGSILPPLVFPSQSAWDAMSDGARALWLANHERTDRGLKPLYGLEANATSVAQAYAEYLLKNNAWGHYADGYSPWQRLENQPAIGACRDFLGVAENLAVFGAPGAPIMAPVERAIYLWLYKDSESNWGHRHTLLWGEYQPGFINGYWDNSGSVGQEGFLGLGRASGGPYQGPFPRPMNYAEIIVLNVFDPCSVWNYGQITFLPFAVHGGE